MRKRKKAYVPSEFHIIRFETENILDGSKGGFMGEDDDLGGTYRINSELKKEVSNQVNPT